MTSNIYQFDLENCRISAIDSSPGLNFRYKIVLFSFLFCVRGWSINWALPLIQVKGKPKIIQGKMATSLGSKTSIEQTDEEGLHLEFLIRQATQAGIFLAALKELNSSW